MAASSAEKIPVDTVENANRSDSSAVTVHRAPDDFNFTDKEKKAIIRRVDRRLVLTVGVLYCISLMDRTNLGAAQIAGMSTDLKLIGNRYVSFLTLNMWLISCLCD